MFSCSRISKSPSLPLAGETAEPTPLDFAREFLRDSVSCETGGSLLFSKAPPAGTVSLLGELLPNAVVEPEFEAAVGESSWNAGLEIGPGDTAVSLVAEDDEFGILPCAVVCCKIGGGEGHLKLDIAMTEGELSSTFFCCACLDGAFFVLDVALSPSNDIEDDFLICVCGKLSTLCIFGSEVSDMAYQHF
ncbi:hypothetical protein OGAPHI_002892 [Ogataea philodendri]|uniref:Uncharacterized protein n=1 Tax=Ogataea philodendri TaxID=1378263 RepID=A0A9P8P808_9ASCO|nr:uncharacterized protein OGAPHI_002892 [Ogataea philodendri]KAH3667243.1 hypothetical protein OGAPHI_002892 [Ogataea philodendri]